ncbi:MAG TPA: DUF2232 domain-containing protein [Terriglobales bacterium]|jgi:uncharacterized protein YybS (DUF2232 family)|nr:DUF2232 domain-containing protein [Terriglobales bacterium]
MVQRLDVTSRFLLALTATAALFLSGMIFPVAGIVAFPLVPQPVLWFGLKYGALNGLGVGVLAMSGLFFLGGKELALLYTVFLSAAGLLFLLLGRIRAIEGLVVATSGVIFTSALAVLRLLYGSWGSMVQAIKISITENLMGAVRVYEKMDIPQESLNLLKERTPQVADRILQLFPAMVFLGLALVVLLNIVLICRRFPERRGEWLSLKALREWKAPDPLVWALIVCGFVLFIPRLGTLQVIAGNFLLVIGAFYFLQGLAIVAFFFNKNKVPHIFRGVIYMFIVFQQICTLLVAALGLLDLWGDFRRLNKKNLSPGQAA